MTMHTTTAQTFSLNLRIPAWATGASVRVNGRLETRPLVPGTFATIRRQWRAGDRIELDLPLRMRLQSVDAEHPDTVAVLAGPLVLMHLLDDRPPELPTRHMLLSARPWQHDPTRWRSGRGADITLRAFPDIGKESYSTYQDVVPA